MKMKRIIILAACISLSLIGRAGEVFIHDTVSIYNGTILKLDIASPVITPAVYKWKMQHYEIGANVRLKDRFFPTAELGYAGGQTNRGDSVSYKGDGGFIRLGVDINPLKKHPESPHALLVGVRIGTAVQGYKHQLKTSAKPYSVAADCWGEVVFGCQVHVIAGFYMGWIGRVKFLFTRELECTPAQQMNAIYIPGYGNRGNMSWGINYHLGWRF